eukprot:15471391-Alexandrium_andersonii.AAC.1
MFSRWQTTVLQTTTFIGCFNVPIAPNFNDVCWRNRERNRQPAQPGALTARALSRLEPWIAPKAPMRSPERGCIRWLAALLDAPPGSLDPRPDLRP